MSQYNVTVANNNITITTATIDQTISVVPTSHALSLSRTGGQGSQGNSISGAEVNASNELIITISDSAGTVVNTINAGEIDISGNTITLDDLQNVDASAVDNGDTIVYNSSTSRWTTRKSSTDDISDIDNSLRAEGAILVYDSTTSKYKSTQLLNSSGTKIIGGTF